MLGIIFCRRPKEAYHLVHPIRARIPRIHPLISSLEFVSRLFLSYFFLIDASETLDRILQNVDENARNADETVRSALQDLEALMAKARDMVELTSSLNAKLTAQEEQRARLTALRPDLSSSSAIDEPEEAKFIRSSLSQLGLQTSAVTQDMVKDDKEWIEQLAKELGSMLVGTRNDKGKEQEGLMRDRGIVGLDEIWGGWNRARGVGASTRHGNHCYILTGTHPCSIDSPGNNVVVSASLTHGD